MAEIPLTVDLIRLGAVVNRVERAADTIDGVRIAGPDEADLPGSAVGGIASPTRVAARLDDVVTRLHGWVTTARMSADAFATAEQNSAARLDVS